MLLYNYWIFVHYSRSHIKLYRHRPIRTRYVQKRFALKELYLISSTDNFKTATTMVFSMFFPPEAAEVATKAGSSKEVAKERERIRRDVMTKRISKEDAETTTKAIEEPRECDYEQNCIKLYAVIEKRNFTVALVFLNTGLWPGDYFKDKLLPKDHLKTWVTRFEGTGSERKVAWSQLPIHLALIQGAPYELIAKMVDMYPSSTRCTDNQLMLPLHLAMRHGSSDRVLECLIRAFPDAVYTTGKNDQTPIEFAKRGPNKIRAAILEAFIKGDNKKSKNIITAAHKLEILDFKMALEDEKTVVLGLEDKIKNMKAKSKREAKEAQEKSRQDIEKIVADYEKKMSKLDLEKKEVELELARKSHELAKKNKELQMAKHAHIRKSTTEREAKAASVPTSSTNTYAPYSVEKKIPTRSEKQAVKVISKQVPKRRLRGFQLRKASRTTIAVEMPTEKSKENSAAKSTDEKERQGNDTKANATVISLDSRLSSPKKTKQRPLIHSPPAYTGEVMSHTSSEQDEQETMLSLPNDLFVTADAHGRGWF
jgi:hypothetical protein